MVQSSAAASSSLTKESSSSLVNFRELCHTLEPGSSSSITTLQIQLRDAKSVFASLGKDYPTKLVSQKGKASADGVTLASGKVIPFDEQQKALHRTISQLHKIDETEVAVLLRIFFDSDDSNLDLLSTSLESFVSPLQQKAAITRQKRGMTGVAKSSDDITTKFFDAFTAFYFEERLYILRCISALIRIADDSFHDLNMIARETLDTFADQSFALKGLSHFHQLTRQELLDDIREVPRYSVFWTKHALREQLALLEIVFLLYYSRLDATAQVVKTIFDVIRDTDFGKEQECSGFFDTESIHLVDCIGNFLVLLAVECLELEKCMEGENLFLTNQETTTDSTSRQLINAPDIVGDLVDFLQTSTLTDVLRAPLLLSFSLILTRIDSALLEWQEARPTESFPDHLKALQTSLLKRGGVGILWPDFVTAALTPSLDIFGTLNSIVTSPLFRTDTPISNLFSLSASSSLALRAVFKGLVLCITQLIRPEYILDYAGLINLWINTFSSQSSDWIKTHKNSADSVAALCAQFWETDFDNTERRAVLNMATRRFPLSFSPLLGLCQALSGESNIPDDHSLRACTAVLGYLAQVNTLSQVMPASPSISLPYEPVESSNSTTTSYRATRNIPVFGKHLIVPAGTVGQVVSLPDQAHIVILWEISGAGYSAWRLIRDVLASFVGLLDPPSLWKSANDYNADKDGSAVFHDKDPIANFFTLAPDQGADYNGNVTANALKLLCTVLNGGRFQAATLLSHLNGDDIGIVEATQPTSVSPKPSLVDITLRILDQSLVSPSTTLPVTLAAIRLLTLLVPSSSTSIWQAMRSSNTLVGSSGSLPFSSPGTSFQTDSTSLLSHEINIGHFTGTLTLLDFYSTLLSNLQSTQYSSPTDTLQLKVEVLSRATNFLINHIWVEYQNWKYVSIRQQIEMGRRCIAFFDQICRDESFQRLPMMRKLVELVNESFLSPVAPLLIYLPLLRTISNGQRLINSLQRGMKQVEAELARKQLVISLQFALTIIHRQGEVKALGVTPDLLGRFESTIFDQDTSLSSSGNLVKAIANLILMPYGHHVNTEAVKLLTCLCRATGNAQSILSTTLIGHLGSLSEVERLIDGLLEIVTDPNQTNNLVIQTWNLMSAMVDTQPALATLLLTGRHLAASVEKHLATIDVAESQQRPTTSSGMIRSAIIIAKEAIVEWKRSFEVEEGASNLHILEGTLKFLNAAWKHALEHQEAFSPLRTDQDFWNAISQLAQVDADIPLPLLPPTIMESFIIDGIDETKCKSEASDGVCRFSLQRVCAARALELLSSDITLAPLLSSKEKCKNRGLSFDRVMAILIKSDHLTSSLQSALRFPCNVLMHDDVFSRWAQTFPEMSLDDFCVPARRDEYDYTRTFGDGYLYDIDVLQKKLQGFAPSVEEELEEDGSQSAALQQAILLVSGLNLNWSIIDAQSCHLSAWTVLLTTMIGPVLDHKSTDQASNIAIQKAALACWIKCAKVTSSEEGESQVTVGIHAERIALLNVLLKLCWGSQKSVAGSDESIRDAIIQIEQIVAHPLFRVEDALRNNFNFPRHVFEMIYLGTREYRRVREKLAPQVAQEQGKANILRAMHLSAEALTLQSISCLRVITENAWTLLSSTVANRDQLIMDADRDLGLLASILTFFFGPESGVSPHIWAPRLQTTALLSAMVDLFSRAPMEQIAGIDSATDLIASGASPIYSQPLLSFFFNLASQSSTSEILVLSGIINGLCNNSLSIALDLSEDPIPPRLANTSYENPAHSCWLQMLHIVVALLANLDGSIGQRFIQTEVWSFFKVYEKKLNQSLDVHLQVRAGFASNSKRGEMGLLEAIRTNQLKEVDLVLKLYLSIIRARIDHVQSQRINGEGSNPSLLFAPFVDKVSVQLQWFVHLLQHPRELTALVGGKGNVKEEEVEVKSLLISASSSIISALWEVGQGSQILCTEPSDWDLCRTIISPTISTTPTSPSSTGTLLDLATYLVETILRIRSGRDKNFLSFYLSTLEQTASLCTTQLVLAAYTRSSSYAMPTRRDLETGLGRDVKQGLESAKGTIQAINESTSFLDILLDFHIRWLHGSD